MKKSKILVPAVALLALSTAAATTGTVAWFTTNTKVKAESVIMSVDAARDLRISDNHSSYDWKTALSWTDSVNNAMPVAAIDGTAASVTALLGDQTVQTNVTSVGFVKPHADNAIKADGTATNPLATGNMTGKFVDVDLGTSTDVIKHDYALRYVGTNTNATVSFKITVGSTAHADINEAFRVGIVDASSAQKKFTAYKLTGYADSTYTLNLSNLTLQNATPYNLTIYTWYEGTDPKCINQYAVSQPLTVKIAHELV